MLPLPAGKALRPPALSAAVFAVQAYVAYSDLIVKAGQHARGHARRVGLPAKKNMDMLAEDLFSRPKATPPARRRPAWDIYEHRVVLITDDHLPLKLIRQPLRRHRIAQEQVAGAFVVHKVAHRVLVGFLPAFRHRLLVSRPGIPPR